MDQGGASMSGPSTPESRSRNAQSKGGTENWSLRYTRAVFAWKPTETRSADNVHGFGVPVAAGILYPFFGILLSPMIAGLAMALSSVCLGLNANRMRRVTLSPDTVSFTAAGGRDAAPGGLGGRGA